LIKFELSFIPLAIDSAKDHSPLSLDLVDAERIVIAQSVEIGRVNRSLIEDRVCPGCTIAAHRRKFHVGSNRRFQPEL
jgi:hypothetical protein